MFTELCSIFPANFLVTTFKNIFSQSFTSVNYSVYFKYSNGNPFPLEASLNAFCSAYGAFYPTVEPIIVEVSCMTVLGFIFNNINKRSRISDGKSN